MASQFGFCYTCGAPRSAGAAQFCASCGASLPALAGAAASAAPPPPPPPTQAWGVPPSPLPQQPWADQQQAGWNAAQQPQQQNWSAAPQQNWGAPPAPQAWGGAPAEPRQRKGPSPLVIVGVLVLVLAVAIGGFLMVTGSKGGTASGSGGPAATARPGATANPGTTAKGGNGGSSLSGASDAFANISSFKFSMTLAGGTYGSMLSMFGGASATGDVPFTMSGTITLKPVKAADITMGAFHIIEIDGYDYVDMGMGTFFKTAVNGSSSMADSFSPETMFSSTVSSSSSSDYTKVGTDTRNGVRADHYQATAAALSSMGSSLGVANATWSSDVWIAVDGGYPVSMSVMAYAADKTLAYQMLFDLSNINDPGNKVTVPTNVSGV
jgi:hypothetical protein